jgi:shikimate kinase
MGGGAYAQANNYELVEENGITIWLDCPLELIRRRIAGQTHRPLAADPARFEQLYHQRHAGYAKADFRVEITNDDPGQALQLILALPIF